MKNTVLTALLLINLSAFAQPKVGFEFGSFSFFDRNEIMYLDKAASWGGNIGVNVAFPLLKSNLAFETGILLHDNYYRLRGPHYSIWYNEKFGSGFRIHEEVNNLAVSIPFLLVWSKGRIQPFIGLEVQQRITSNDKIECGLGNMSAGNPIFFYGRGEDLIDLAGFNWCLDAGLYWACSPRYRLKVQYARGMNTYATHHISPKIINEVNEGGTTVQSTPIDRFQLGLVYTPDWKRKKEQVTTKEKKQDKKTMKEILKSIYQ